MRLIWVSKSLENGDKNNFGGKIQIISIFGLLAVLLYYGYFRCSAISIRRFGWGKAPPPIAETKPEQTKYTAVPGGIRDARRAALIPTKQKKRKESGEKNEKRKRGKRTKTEKTGKNERTQ